MTAYALMRERAEAAEARVKELERIAELRELEQQTAKIAEDRIGQLEAQNARLRAALERLDALYISEFDHEDRPPRPQWLQEALNGEEAK